MSQTQNFDEDVPKGDQQEESTLQQQQNNLQNDQQNNLQNGQSTNQHLMGDATNDHQNNQRDTRQNNPQQHHQQNIQHNNQQHNQQGIMYLPPTIQQNQPDQWQLLMVQVFQEMMKNNKSREEEGYKQPDVQDHDQMMTSDSQRVQKIKALEEKPFSQWVVEDLKNSRLTDAKALEAVEPLFGFFDELGLLEIIRK